MCNPPVFYALAPRAQRLIFPKGEGAKHTRLIKNRCEPIVSVIVSVRAASALARWRDRRTLRNSTERLTPAWDEPQRGPSGDHLASKPCALSSA
jgi:hypothetical protein